MVVLHAVRVARVDGQEAGRRDARDERDVEDREVLRHVVAVEHAVERAHDALAAAAVPDPRDARAVDVTVEQAARDRAGGQASLFGGGAAAEILKPTLMDCDPFDPLVELSKERQAVDDRVEIKEYDDLVIPPTTTHAFYVQFLLPIWFDIQVIEYEDGAGPQKNWVYR